MHGQSCFTIIFDYDKDTSKILGTRVEVFNMKQGQKVGNERVLVWDSKDNIIEEKYGNNLQMEVKISTPDDKI